MGKILEKVKDIFESIEDARNERKMVSTYKRIVRKASYSNFSFLKYYLSQKSVFVIIVCLQFISFFTTWAGAKYYLGNVFPLAPLFFTTGIQLGFFTFSNEAAQNENRKGGQIFLLCLFALISMCFSYTGLAMTALPPDIEYEQTFNEYKSEAEVVQQQLLDNNLAEQEIIQEVSDVFTNVQMIIGSADAEIERLKSIIGRSDEIIENDTVTSTEYGENGEVISITESTGDAAAAVAGNISEYEGQLTQIKNAREGLSNTLDNIDQNQVIDYVISDDKSMEGETALRNNLTNMIYQRNRLSDMLNIEESRIEENYFESLRDRYAVSIEIQEVNTPLQKEITVSSNNTDTWEGLLEFATSMINSDSSADEATQILRELRNLVDNNYLELNALVSQLELVGEIDLTGLTRTKAEMDSYGDPNLQALSYIIQSEYRNRIGGILVLAILVDGLTFILGLVGNQKSLALLDSKTNREIDNEDQLFAIIFVSLMNEKIPEKLLSNKDKRKFERACIEYVTGIKDMIQIFLSKFKNSPWTSQWGYGLYAPYSAFEECQGIIPIISILHQLGYIQFINKNDFILLRKHYNGYSGDGMTQGSTGYELNDYICILRYRAELYLRNNTAEIATNFIFDTEEDDETEENYQ